MFAIYDYLLMMRNECPQTHVDHICAVIGCIINASNNISKTSVPRIVKYSYQHQFSFGSYPNCSIIIPGCGGYTSYMSTMAKRSRILKLQRQSCHNTCTGSQVYIGGYIMMI